MDSEVDCRKMQVKVLYSFNNTSTVFLSRSTNLYSVKVAQILSANGTEEIMLGGYELKNCIQQILSSSPENFQLQTEDYAVYYKDLTEQPDEPFVSNGILSELLKNSDSNLIPGRVCQNVSASFLFGNKTDSASLTLEVRLKLHTIDRATGTSYVDGPSTTASMSVAPSPSTTPSSISQKRRNDYQSQEDIHNRKQQRYHQRSQEIRPSSNVNTGQYYQQRNSKSSNSNNFELPEKATRTKSLPAFYPQPYNNMYNIRNADKLNTPSRYDSRTVLDRFKLAPFVDAQVIDKPKVLKIRKEEEQYRHRLASGNASRQNSMVEPIRAMRTRSMVTNRQTPLMISSPIHEEGSSDTDDTEYNENHPPNMDDEEEDEEEELDEEEEEVADNGTSPYTPQQPPYRPSNEKQHAFHSLPDLEDLDSKKTHTLHSHKLPENHGLECVNSNCITTSSITWRYFEIDFHPNFFNIHRATEFDKKNYEGMYGPLCNACYLFLRNKGFMRPEAVVKKYLKQQQYKKELREKEEKTKVFDKSLPPPNKRPTPLGISGSSPIMSSNSSRNNSGNSNNHEMNHTTSNHRFITPSHTPSEINQAIQNARMNQNQNDLTDFMNQLNNFGGPLTDIDPLPQDQIQGVTPPMMATKSNTRVINIDQNGEDKENCPPIDVTHFNSSSSPARNGTEEFEKMIVRSFNHKSSPMDGHTDWMNSLFGEGPTPKDQVTPRDSTNTTQVNNSGSKPKNQGMENSTKINAAMPQMKTFSTRRSPRLNKSKLSINSTMPSSPLSANRRGSLDDKLFMEEPNLDMIEHEINSLARGSENFNGYHQLGNKIHHESPQISSATRNDTTNLVLSLSKPNSSPNSEIFNLDTK